MTTHRGRGAGCLLEVLTEHMYTLTAADEHDLEHGSGRALSRVPVAADHQVDRRLLPRRQ